MVHFSHDVPRSTDTWLVLTALAGGELRVPAVGVSFILEREARTAAATGLVGQLAATEIGVTFESREMRTFLVKETPAEVLSRLEAVREAMIAAQLEEHAELMRAHDTAA